MKKQNTWMLAIGLLVISSSFIIKRFVDLSDFIDGLIKGLGIGLMIVALWRERGRRTAAH